MTGTWNLLRILKSQEPRNVVLLGSAGLHKEAAARELAANWLSTSIDQLELHPDFLYVEPIEGSILSEEAGRIQRKAMYQADRKIVCIISRAELMTKALQNKLLKVLEDAADHLAIIFVSADPLLDTVMSRCVIVRFCPLCMDKLKEKYGPSAKPAALLAADGCMGTYEKILEDTDFFIYLDGFLHAFIHMKTRVQLKGLLMMTHALREKDREYLPEKLLPWQMQAFLVLCRSVFFEILLEKRGLTESLLLPIRSLSSCYTEAETLDCFYHLDQAVYCSQNKGKFSKNDFFELLIHMIPDEGKESLR